ncbi:MAG TPA: hypothetical protein VK812_12315 [Candidatus Binatus sp.]|jgi:hypothetical protein|nr:hypothetical protein [Candidatus Binatus sp.]
MPKTYAEFKLSITGKINGQDITPLTLPMARLAEYLTDFATLLGHKEYVHFTNVEEGSAAPVALVEIEKHTQVRDRIKQAASGTGLSDAPSIYAKLNTRFTEDEGYGAILEKIGDKEVGVIEFPGKKRRLSPIYGPIKESAFVQGELKRVGGQEPTIPVHVQDSDGKWYYCWTRKPIAVQLASFLFQEVRLNGIATWQRDENSTWTPLDFEVQSFIAPLGHEAPSTILSELRAMPGNDWNELDDPLGELRRLRHGEDDLQ